jgi:hypothetical protein
MIAKNVGHFYRNDGPGRIALSFVTSDGAIEWNSLASPISEMTTKGAFLFGRSARLDESKLKLTRHFPVSFERCPANAPPWNEVEGPALAQASIRGREFIMMTHLRRSVAALLSVAAAGGAGLPVEFAGSAAAETFGPEEAVTLTDAQRAKILRAIVLNHGNGGPAGQQRVIDEPSRPPQPPHGSSVPTGDITVGTAIPQTLPLTPLPDSVTVEVPAVRRLSYAVVNGRLLLVDPTTNIVLGEINR